MPRSTPGADTPVESVDDLHALAAGLEAAADAAYARLAARMGGMGRKDLAGLFEGLAQDARQRGGTAEARVPAGGGLPFFDDEGMGETAPALASAYGAFGMAVRNAQRAFAFWTYVAAHAASDAVREAAEEMASAALARAAGLRRERRRAFHAERAAVAGAPSWTLMGLELRLAELLTAAAGKAASPALAARLAARADEAEARAAALDGTPLNVPPLLKTMRPEAVAHCRPTAELLLDGYLDLAETLPTQNARAAAQGYAEELLDALLDIAG